jgi:hypothetical protein
MFPCVSTSIYTGPPSAPNITYVDHDSLLYISAYSHMEFPVLYFDVEITDITGVPSELSGRYNASSGDPLVLQINSSVCLPVMISVNATNDIGTNSSYSTLPLNYGMNTSTYAFFNNSYIH